MSIFNAEHKINLWGVAASIIILVGVLNPWLMQRYDPIIGWDYEKREIDVTYEVYSKLAPFFFSVSREGKVVSTKWFIDFESTLAGAMLLFASIFCVFRYNNKEIGFYLFLLSILAMFIFVFGLRSGIGLGIITFTTWGFKITLVGIFFLFLSSMSELLSRH